MKQIFVSISLFLLILGLTCCINPQGSKKEDSAAGEPAPWDLVEDGQTPSWEDEDQYEEIEDAEIDAQSGNDTVNMEDAVEIAEIPDSLLHRDRPLSRYNRLGKLKEIFNDSNKYQYAVGERIGISPIRSVADAYYLRRPLVEISSCQYYEVEKLTHSIPFLVPEAANLLETIGRNFSDSVNKLKAPGHKIYVTSLLRTAHSVKRLRRVNRNATDSSTHQLGTTFDITYSRFVKPETGLQLSDEELKYILAEVILDLRRKNKCMVKYEVHSPCFHITATGK